MKPKPASGAHRTRSGDRGGGIARRDFLNGVLLAAGGAAVGRFFPMRAFAHGTGAEEIGVGVCDGSIGLDPRARRGGNVPSAFNVGHWLRDGRLSFGTNSVRLAPSKCDSNQGHSPILDDGGTYEVIIVGSGMAGLAAAFYLTRQRPGTRSLLLDANPLFGGNAARDDAPPIPTIASTAGAYAATPYDDFLFEIYGTVGIDWAAHYVPDPFYSYFFDERTPFVLPGTQSWTLDVYGAGRKDMPYPPPILQDLQQARQDFRNWYDRAGSPTDPADNSDPQCDYLAGITLHDYLTTMRGFHPAVSNFYTRFAVDALAGTSEQVSAYTSISFLGAECYPIFTFPGGTSGIARHVLKWLISEAIDGTTSDEIVQNPIRDDRLDQETSAARVRQGAMVLRADTASHGASVVYYWRGQFYRAAAKAVIVAGQAHTAHRMVEHLLDAERLEAWEAFTLVPVVMANVSIRRAAPLVYLGLGYNQYYWGSKHWADFVVADWASPDRFESERPTVLTFYGANVFPPDDMPDERVKLLTTPFADYEQSLREDLNRILAPGGFDFDRDVTAVYIYRWGHGMVFPKPGFPFGPPLFKKGRAVRTLSPRHVARAQLGRISFAGQDTESSPAIESAIGSGLRTALEVLPLL